MRYGEMYRSKRRTAEEAAKLVKSGDWVDYAMGHGTPPSLDRAVAARKGELQDIKMRGMLTDKKTGEIRSRIVPTLSQGSVVSDPRSQTPVLVTEYGKANLAGRATWERAERLIALAHPRFREELIAEAGRMGIWRRRNRR